MIIYKMVKYILKQPDSTHIAVKKGMDWTDDQFNQFISGDKYITADEIYKLSRILNKTITFFEDY